MTAGGRDGEGETDDGNRFGQQQIDLVRPVVVVLDDVGCQDVEFVCPGVRRDRGGVAPEGPRFDRHGVRCEEVDPEADALAPDLFDLLGQRVGGPVSTGEEPQRARPGRCRDQGGGAGTAGHGRGQDGIVRAESPQR